MCSFVVPDAKQFGIKKIQVDEQIGMSLGLLAVAQNTPLLVPSKNGNNRRTGSL